MGLIISRFRKKKSTKELLEKIQKDVEEIEEYRSHTQQRQKRLVGSLVLYSIVLYLVAALVCYFYYFPDTLEYRVLYAVPFIGFPFLVYILKRLLTWYYCRKISKNEEKLKNLLEQREKILEQVMETETYKVAKELLERFAPDQLRRNQMHKTTGVGVPSPVISHHPDVRRRVVSTAPTPQTRPQMQPPGLPHQTPSFTPRPLVTSHATPVRPVSSVGPVRSVPAVTATPGPSLPRPPLGTPSATQVSSFQTPIPRGAVVRGEGGPPGPPMPRPVLPRERGYLDRFIEYLVGDGPANRFALVCRQCESHNGMALEDEFQYLAFRCAYCYYWNPARKQRPLAPRLETLAPQLPPPLSTTQDEEEEEEEEDQESSSGEEEGEEEEEEEAGAEESESNNSSGEEEEEEEEEGPASSEMSSTKAMSSQEGSLEDLAKSTPSSGPTTSDDHQLAGEDAASRSAGLTSSSTTPPSTTEAEETE